MPYSALPWCQSISGVAFFINTCFFIYKGQLTPETHQNILEICALAWLKQKIIEKALNYINWDIFKRELALLALLKITNVVVVVVAIYPD